MADCWNLLKGRREHYLPRGEKNAAAASAMALAV